MKKWCLAALALANTALTASFAQLPSGYGIHYSPQELAVWRQRAVSGPYRATGDVTPYSPGDWNRTVSFANAFKAAPMVAGNDNLESRQIWSGSATQNGVESPVWQGFKMQAAAFYYLVKGDTSHGHSVRRALLHQTTIAAANVGLWPLTTPYEHGFGEANWLVRLLTSYDYTKDLFTSAERTKMDNWFRGAANFYCTRITSGPIGQCFPRRLQDDYTILSRDAQPGGIPSYADPIYPKSTAARNAFSPDGYIYTHVNPDSSLGNKVSRLAMHYNNRYADKMSFVGLLGVFLNDAFFKLHAKQYAKEWLKYSVYPDGTFGEYERNGDYSNVNQGLQYGAKNVAQFVFLADALARKGDFSLYQYVTTQGAHNTIGGPKSLLSVLTRYANHCIGADPIYYASVSEANRIDNITDYNGRMYVWDYMLAISNKYYKSDFLKNVYKRVATGAVPYNGNFTSVGGVWVPWNGPCGEMPGVMLMNGQLEDLNVYQYPCQAPVNLQVQGVSQTAATITWDGVSLAQTYKVRYRINGATTWTETTPSSNTFSLSGLVSGTNYQVQVQTACQAGNVSSWSATLSFTTEQAPCIVPANLRVASVTATSASILADTVPGAVSYTVEHRIQGSTPWTPATVSAFPAALSLAAGTTYEARVRTNCTGGLFSAFSPEITFTTGVLPCQPPTDLNATALLTDSVVMEWTAVSLASQYNVRFKPVASSNWKFVVVSTNRHSEGNLLSGTRYEIQVMTNCQAGNSSAFTSSAFFTTGVPPCPTVSSVAVAQITQSSATVSYTANGTGVLGYQVRYRKVGAAAWVAVNDQASPLSLSSLSHSTQYEVQVRALCALDSSTFTASSLFTTSLPPCNTPTSFAATGISQTGTQLVWSPVADAASYEVQFRTGTTAFTTVSSPQPTLSLAGLNTGADYEARVRSNCPGGQSSSYSALIAFRTLDPACEAPTGLSFSGITATQATISWTMLSGMASYTLRYRKAGQTNWTTIPTAQSPRVLAGLSGATQYEVQVQAICGSSRESSFTQSVTFSTVGQVCYTPINLAARVENEDSVFISWSGIPGSRGYLVTFWDPANPNGPRRVDTVATHQNGFTGFLPGRQYSINVATLCSFGTSYASTSLQFTMPTGCMASGTVRKEVWSNLNWQAGQPVPNRTPDYVAVIPSLEDSSSVPNGNILARVKGFICPPATGNYTFYLSGADVSETYLSTGTDSSSRQRIAFLTQASGYRQFNSMPSATSATIRLVRGQKYLLEIIYASATSKAHFALAWKTPEGESVRLISGTRFTSAAGPASPVATSQEAETVSGFTLYPNPANRAGQVFLKGPEGSRQIVIADAAGKVAWQGRETSENGLTQLPNESLTPGMYIVQVLGVNGKRQVLRMVIE